jgi:RNA polymerase sigma factor for flagellar operon FliA
MSVADGDGSPRDRPRSADIVGEGMELVTSVARALARRLGGQIPVDDLRSIGNLALVEIMESWDPERARFAPYATWRLRCAMLDGVRKETHGRWSAARASALLACEHLSQPYVAGDAAPSDVPTTQEQDEGALGALLGSRAAALAVGLLAADPDAQIAETPEEQVAWVEALHVVRAHAARLPDAERALVERHYFGGEPFDAVARDLGVTKSWASRLHQRAILTLRRAFEPAGPDSPDAPAADTDR